DSGEDLINVAAVFRSELTEEVQAAVQLPGRARILARVEQALQPGRYGLAAVVRDGSAPRGADRRRRAGREGLHLGTTEVRLDERAHVLADVDMPLAEGGS